MIRAGRVAVDGAIVTQLGTKVDARSAEIRVDGRPLRPQALRYVVLNKPRGYITTTEDERDRQTVMDLVPVRERLFPVGRLDRDTEGLLLLTNDGEVANRVMHPRYRLPKEYMVLTPSRPSELVLAKVRHGITIEGKEIVPEEFRIFRETREGVLLTVTVHEGLNRLVRRIMDEAGIPVSRLRRVRVGPLQLGNIPLGTFRDLSPGELTSLLQALRLDRGEDDSLARPVTRGGRLLRPGRARTPAVKALDRRPSPDATTDRDPASQTPKRSEEGGPKPRRAARSDESGPRSVPRPGRSQSGTRQPDSRPKRQAAPEKERGTKRGHPSTPVGDAKRRRTDGRTSNPTTGETDRDRQ
jgi:23S rRNA pseudouridine2605 synthase